MEELRSLEFLDKQITEEAKIKADKIIKNAQIQAQKILADTSVRLQKNRKVKEEFYENQLKHYQQDMEANIPLEEERFLVSFEDDAVSSAIQNYFEKMEEDKKIYLLSVLLQKYKKILTETSNSITSSNNDLTVKLHVKTSTLNTDKLKKIVLDTFGDDSIASCCELSQMEAKNIFDLTHEIYTGQGNLEGMILESADKSVICHVTLSVIIENLMNKYLEELTTTLFCGRLPK